MISSYETKNDSSKSYKSWCFASHMFLETREYIGEKDTIVVIVNKVATAKLFHW